MGDYHHILVGISGEMMDDKILSTAERFLNPNVVLDVVCIIDYPEELLLMNGEAGPVDNEYNVNQHHSEKARQYVENLLEQHHLLDKDNVHLHVFIGNARHLLIHELPKQFNSELIIIGRSNHIDFEDMMLGNITKHVASKAPCDILLVNP